MAHVEFSRTGAIATLRLNRPQKLNALTLEMHRLIFEGLNSFRTDKALKVLIITGTGRAFCAGDDMKESDPRDGAIPPEEESEISWHNMIRLMRGIPKPVIAAVNGLACGAGSGLVLGSDIRIAAETAQFADIFIRRGIPGGACLLTQTVGTAKALELIFTGDFVDAAECHRIGIFNRVVKSENLMEQATAFAERLAGGPTESIGLSKLAVYQAAHLPLNEALRTEELAKLCGLRSREVREGISAFNDKRVAAFSKRD